MLPPARYVNEGCCQRECYRQFRVFCKAEFATITSKIAELSQQAADTKADARATAKAAAHYRGKGKTEVVAPRLKKKAKLADGDANGEGQADASTPSRPLEPVPPAEPEPPVKPEKGAGR